MLTTNMQLCFTPIQHFPIVDAAKLIALVFNNVLRPSLVHLHIGLLKQFLKMLLFVISINWKTQLIFLKNHCAISIFVIFCAFKTNKKRVLVTVKYCLTEVSEEKLSNRTRNLILQTKRKTGVDKVRNFCIFIVIITLWNWIKYSLYKKEY